jgi:hypothetical protein
MLLIVYAHMGLKIVIISFEKLNLNLNLNLKNSFIFLSGLSKRNWHPINMKSFFNFVFLYFYFVPITQYVSKVFIQHT